MAAKFGVFVAMVLTRFLRYTGYLNFIKGILNRDLIANSSSCTNTLSMLNPCNHMFCKKVCEKNGIKQFWSIRIYGEM